MKRLLARCLSLLLLLPLGACAQERLVDVQVVDLDQGNWLTRMPYSGREYIEGRPGHRFAVSLHNLTGQRVLAVLSVDGVNAISGETAGSSQAGYVLDPHQQVEIRGWRKSYADVAEFYFTDLPDSYAARTGRPANVGVIGVAAFREKRPAPIAYTPPPYYPPYTPAPYERRDDYAQREGATAKSAAPPATAAADAAGSSGALARSESSPSRAQPQQIGTGHGARRYDPVTQTEFERAFGGSGPWSSADGGDGLAVSVWRSPDGMTHAIAAASAGSGCGEFLGEQADGLHDGRRPPLGTGGPPAGVPYGAVRPDQRGLDPGATHVEGDDGRVRRYGRTVIDGVPHGCSRVGVCAISRDTASFCASFCVNGVTPGNRAQD
jgi:hypothetical protein